jgi:hypothetical protein
MALKAIREITIIIKVNRLFKDVILQSTVKALRYYDLGGEFYYKENNYLSSRFAR